MAMPYSIHQDGKKRDVVKLEQDFQIGLEPDLGIEVVIKVAETEIPGKPRAIDNQRQRYSSPWHTLRRLFERFPLFRAHGSFVLCLTPELSARGARMSTAIRIWK